MRSTRKQVKEETIVRSFKGILNGHPFRLLALALVVTLGLVAAAFAGASSAASKARSGSTVAVKTRKIGGYGTVLVNPKGRTLYIFMKDARRHVTCTGSCAGFWPPVKWKSTAKPTAGGTAKTSLLGSDKDPSGGRVVTYNKWPLYTYSGDSAAGQAKGEGLNLSGGKWYLISPKGTLITHKSSSGGGGTTTSGGGGGWG
jgi:predicted lipoprotein with Yx(FWY)xxD motif